MRLEGSEPARQTDPVPSDEGCQVLEGRTADPGPDTHVSGEQHLDVGVEDADVDVAIDDHDLAQRLTELRAEPADAAAIISMTALRWPGASRPTDPRSISTIPPSGSTRMLPGCGSAW